MALIASARWARTLALVVGLGSTPGCTAAPPAAPAPAAPKTASSAPSAASPDVVAEPLPDVVAHARTKSGARARDACSVGSSMDCLLFGNAQLHQVPGPILEAFAQERPVESLVIVHKRLVSAPQIHVVTTTDLRSLEPARALVGAGAAGTEIQDRPEEIAFRWSGGACIAFSVHRKADSATGARLACSDDVEVLEEHIPFLRFGPPPPADAADTTVHVRGSALRATAGSALVAARALGPTVLRGELQRMAPRLAAAFEPLLPALVSEGVDLIEDLDHVHLDLTRNVNGWRDLRVRARFTGDASWVSKTLRSPPADGAPHLADLLTRMPADAHTSFFLNPTAARSLEPLRATAMDFYVSSLHPTVRDVLFTTFVPKQGMIYATGFVPVDLPVGGISASKVPHAEWIRRNAVGRFGWHIVVLPERADRYVAFIEKGMKSFNDGPFREFFHAALPNLCRGLPDIKRRPLREEGLPKDGSVWEMSIPGSYFDRCSSRDEGAGFPVPPSVKGAKPARSTGGSSGVDGVLVVVPDGERTVLGLSLVPNVLYDRLRQVLLRLNTPAGGSASPAAIVDADRALREGAPFFGARLSLAGIVFLDSNIESIYRDGYTGGASVGAARTSAHGDASMPVALRASPDGDDAVVLELTAQIPPLPEPR